MSKKSAILILLPFILMATLAYPQQASGPHESFITLAAKANWSCLKLQASFCPTPNPPFVGIYLKYWEPSLFIETVKKPGDYVISESGALIGDGLQKLANIEAHTLTNNSNVDVTSTSLAGSLNGTNLQFNDVHVFDFPIKMFLEGVLCPSIGNGSFGLRYVSEADTMGWRKDDWELKIPGQVGTWGPLYPRSGFLIHFSSLVASALTGVRATDIAGFPQAHVVTSRLDFTPDFLRDRVQMVYPYTTTCFSLGENLAPLNSQHSKDGRYVWIYWHYRECCRSID